MRIYEEGEKTRGNANEYDFGFGVKGKHAKKFAEGTNLVLQDPDMSKLFPDSNSVNNALRLLGKIAKKSKKKAG